MTSPYRCFNVTLADRARLSESFVRLTLRGDDLHKCGTTLLDQRVKLALGESSVLDPLFDDHWFAAWSNATERAALRTYTLSDVRPREKEVDVDVVLHGAPGEGAGPASAFAQDACLGDRLVLIAPDIDIEGHEDSGVAYHPGAASRVVLVADATALPAVANILAKPQPGVSYEALIEVPHSSDIRELASGRVTWRVAEYGESVLDVPPFTTVPAPTADVAAPERGVTLNDGVDDPRDAGNAPDPRDAGNVPGPRDAGNVPGPRDAGNAPDPRDAGNAPDPRDAGTGVSEGRGPDEEMLWDEAEGTDGGTYLWVAGEAAMVRAVRAAAKRAGFDRNSSSFMGYWRAGRASD